MSEMTQTMAAVEECVSQRFADAEIKGIESQDDGSFEVKVMVKGRDTDATYQDTDAGTESDTTQDQGGSDTDTDTTEGGDDTDTDRATWTVNGKEFGFNELQTAVSESPADYPAGADGDTLAETLAEVVNTTEGGEDTDEPTEDDTSEDDTNDETENDGVSDAYLLNSGISENNLEKVKEFREKNGICEKEGCEYGANDDSDYCASHQTRDTQKGGGTTEGGESNAEKVEQITDLFGVSNTEAREAVEAVNNDLFPSVSDALDQMS